MTVDKNEDPYGFIKGQISKAIDNAEKSKGTGDCKSHDDMIDFQILTMQVSELGLSEMKALKKTVDSFVDDRKVIKGLWKVAAGTITIGGGLWIVLQIVSHLKTIA